MLSAHRSAPAFRHDAAVSSWLYRIVVNACLDRLRRSKTHPTTALQEDICQVGDPAPRVDTAIVVERALCGCRSSSARRSSPWTCRAIGGRDGTHAGHRGGHGQEPLFSGQGQAGRGASTTSMPAPPPRRSPRGRTMSRDGTRSPVAKAGAKGDRRGQRWTAARATAAGRPMPITPEMLADLQAGLLDDATARGCAGGLHRSRCRRGLGRRRARHGDGAGGRRAAGRPTQAGGTSTPVGSSRSRRLRRKAAHAARGSRPRSRRLRRLGALAGLFAAVVAVGLGAVMLVRPPPAPSSGPTAEHVTVSPRRTVYRCPTRRSSGCLPTGPTTGRSPTRNAERPASTAWAIRRPPRCSVPGPWTSPAALGVLLVLPGDTAKTVVALVVAPNCSAAGTELLASTVVTRP